MRNHRNREEKEYTGESLRQEREYGLFWYSWLWHFIRPFMIALCVALVVTGVVMAAWNSIDRHFFAPVDENDPSEITFTVASGSSLTRVANNLEAENLIRKTDGGLGAGKAGIGSAVIQSLANLDGRKSGSQGGFHLLLESIKILAGRQRYQGHQHAQTVAERAA